MIVFALPLIAGVRANLSDSQPGWLYYVVPVHETPKVGDLVVLVLPPNLGVFAAERGYVPLGAYVLKRVAALPGQRVRVRQGLNVDGRGRPLRAIVGIVIVPQGDFWADSDNPRGFDSRYLGTLPISSIVAEAWRIW